MRSASLIAAALLFALPAAGQNDKEADRLFAEGRQLVREGRYAEACPKFERAQRLRAGVGTLLNLADCHERRGKTASAVEVFRQAEALAEAAKDKRADLARTRIEALEPRLVKLEVVVPNVDGVEVTLDSRPYPRERWGNAAPVDPGPHVVAATAPGQSAFSKRVDIFRGSVSVHVVFEKASAAKPVPMAVKPSDATTDSSALSTQRMVAVGVAGIGVVGVGVSAGFGFASLRAKNEADDHCQLGPSGDQCDSTGVDAGDRAIARGTVSTIAFIAGSAAIAAGAVLWLTDSPEDRRGVGLTPFGVRGRF
jgi:serine/threonine-protein kinase